jgi:hypothetical protein
MAKFEVIAGGAAQESPPSSAFKVALAQMESAMRALLAAYDALPAEQQQVGPVLVKVPSSSGLLRAKKAGSGKWSSSLRSCRSSGAQCRVVRQASSRRLAAEQSARVVAEAVSSSEKDQKCGDAQTEQGQN